jgi:protein gp37
MGLKSNIEWTEATWNPVTGCTKVSPGCKHCYAERLALRLRAMGNIRYLNGFKVSLHSDQLGLPLRWTQSQTIFVNSMSDLFHAKVPTDYILAVAKVMQLANWHTYQVLAKRSERMRDLLQTKLIHVADQPHIWWGVSVENRKHGLPRIDHLRAAPAKVRFLSIEPLLEDLGPINLEGIHWVIAGGESGAGARPMKKEWVLSIRDQCQKAGVSFFFKQWGGVRKSQTGRMLDGRTYDQFPQRVKLPVVDKKKRLTAIAEVADSLSLASGTIDLSLSST